LLSTLETDLENLASDLQSITSASSTTASSSESSSSTAASSSISSSELNQLVKDLTTFFTDLSSASGATNPAPASDLSAQGWPAPPWLTTAQSNATDSTSTTSSTSTSNGSTFGPGNNPLQTVLNALEAYAANSSSQTNTAT
jgi:hypothetical protein